MHDQDQDVLLGRAPQQAWPAAGCRPPGRSRRRRPRRPRPTRSPASPRRPARAPAPPPPPIGSTCWCGSPSSSVTIEVRRISCRSTTSRSAAARASRSSGPVSRNAAGCSRSRPAFQLVQEPRAALGERQRDHGFQSSAAIWRRPGGWVGGCAGRADSSHQAASAATVGRSKIVRMGISIPRSARTRLISRVAEQGMPAERRRSRRRRRPAPRRAPRRTARARVSSRAVRGAR